jgi:non-specific serine/threonine protein kinase/serine/threonine-protein kinase
MSDASNDKTLSFSAGETPFSSIGPYRLVQRIGVGGMGEVWRAEQTAPFHRTVALKLIKAGMDTRAALARFESERQALALMEHPNIAKVFDAGATPEGRPYFVMECVPGLPITSYCDSHRLTIHDRLALFTQVCDGVQHAHQKAIIHRDLKPSNVLVIEVDRKPVPKIIDFGLAKATGMRLSQATLYTEAGGVVGTPDYMSPEQADSSERNIDTRTDVYSLGVILYELLVGVLPYGSRSGGAGTPSMLEKIRGEEPTLPSSKLKAMGESSHDSAAKRQEEPHALRRHLRGELDWITMKALEKERSRRYGSPSELSAEIQRYLNNEPVLAGPPSSTYRAGKFIRRHRFGVGVAVAAVILLVAFAVTMALQARRIAKERDRANREAAASERVTDFMAQMFKVSDPGQARGNSITAREILDKASNGIDTGLANDPQLQARMMNVMGTVYENLGLFSQAEALFRHALEIRRASLGDKNKDTLQSIYSLAEVLTWTGSVTEAEKLCRESFEARKSVLGSEHRDTLTSMSWLAWILFIEGRYPEAEKLDRDTIEIARRVLGPRDNLTLSALSRLGIVLGEEGKYPEAEATLRQVLEDRRQRLGLENTDTLASANNLANLLANEGKNAEAEKLDRDTLPIYRRVFGTDNRKTLMVVENLAIAVKNQGRYVEAEQLERDALEIERNKFGLDNRSTLIAMSNLAETLMKEGRYPEAEQLLRQAIDGKRRILRPEHPSVLTSMDSLGSILKKEKRYAEAEKTYRQVLEGRSHALGTDSPETAESAYGLACVLALEGKRDESFTNLQFAVDHAPNGDVRNGLGSDADLKLLHGDPRFAALLADPHASAAALQTPPAKN